MVCASILIAIVDDEASLRRALGRLLGAHGYQTLVLASGEDLFGELAVRPIDCVILDLHMPGIDGFEVLSRLAASTTPVPPVIVLTGHDSPESRTRVEVIGGVSAFLRKPVDEQTLIGAIDSAIHPRNPNHL